MCSARWAFNFGRWNPTQPELLLATSCVQPEEKQRIAKFVFKKDFKSSLIGRLLMRKYIQTVTKLSYDEIKIFRDEKNKPFVKTDLNFSFNVSHQGNFTVLSGEVGTKIGVDVMKIEYSGGKSLDDFFRIMNRQFSQSEWVQINDSGSDSARLKTFCRNWCLKEAYVKAVGVGITVNLQKITFKINTPVVYRGDVVTDTELYIDGKKMPWIFEESLLDEEHCVATALNTDDYEPKEFTIIDFEELMENSIPLLDNDLEYCRNFFSKND